MARRRIIATRSPRLSDALLLTSLPREIRASDPDVEILASRLGFNPVVFQGNPLVQGKTWALPQESPSSLLLAQQKPELYLSPLEIEWAKTFLMKNGGTYAGFPENEKKPLCVLHAWYSVPGQGGRPDLAPVDFWDGLVSRWKEHYRFWQVGMLGHGAIQGCEYYLLFNDIPREARKLFAFMKQAKLFVGVDSAPMWVARAFDIPSLIFMSEEALPAFLESPDNCRRIHVDSKIFKSAPAGNLELNSKADLFFKTYLGQNS